LIERGSIACHSEVEAMAEQAREHFAGAVEVARALFPYSL
jgi:hypothetical protein